MKPRILLLVLLIVATIGLFVGWLWLAAKPNETSSIVTAIPAVPAVEAPKRLAASTSKPWANGATPTSGPTSTTAHTPMGHPIHYASGPPDGEKVVAERLHDDAADLVKGTGYMRTWKETPELAMPDQLQIEQPLGIYDLVDFSDVTYDGKSSTTKFFGYYYLVETSDKIVAACTVFGGNSGAASEVVDLNTGNPAFGSILTGLKQLPDMPEIRGGSYEARILLSRGFFVAIWLKSENGGKDWIYLCTPGIAGLKGETLMTVEDFLKPVQKAVQEMQASQQTPLGLP